MRCAIVRSKRGYGARTWYAFDRGRNWEAIKKTIERVRFAAIKMEWGKNISRQQADGRHKFYNRFKMFTSCTKIVNLIANGILYLAEEVPCKFNIRFRNLRLSRLICKPTWSGV